MSSEIDILPEGWQKTTLEHLIIRISNGVNVTQYEEKIGLPITRIETIWNGTIDLNRVKYIKEDSDELRLKYGLRHGDILFSHINSDSHLGKTAIFRSQVKCLIHGTNLLLIRPSAEISSEYLNYQIQFLRQKGEFVAVAQRAVNQSSINQRKLKAFEFLLPPLNEQHRIVAKIEELFSELDKGVESLKAARAKLNVYRQAVLKHAFEGKLTARWREETKDKLETPEQLLARIKQEREARYEQQLQKWKAAVKTWEAEGKPGKKPSMPKKVKDANSVPSTDSLGALPTDWRWITVSEIADLVTDGTHYTPNYTNSGVPFISVKDVRHGKVNFDDCKFISRDDHDTLIQRCHPEPGDLLITKSGTIGRLAIVPDKEISLFVSVALVKIQSAQAYISSRWLRYAFEHHIMGLNIDQQIKGGVLKNYHLEDLRLAILPFCGVREQEELVRQVEKKFSVLEELETALDQQLVRADAMRQSILKRAFSGQLVPQDPHDEPASILLDRIRAEREQVAKNNHSKKTKKRKTTA